MSFEDKLLNIWSNIHRLFGNLVVARSMFYFSFINFSSDSISPRAIHRLMTENIFPYTSPPSLSPAHVTIIRIPARFLNIVRQSPRVISIDQLSTTARRVQRRRKLIITLSRCVDVSFVAREKKKSPNRPTEILRCTREQPPPRSPTSINFLRDTL